VENEAFDDERDGTARDKVAVDLKVVLARKCARTQSTCYSWDRMVVQYTIMVVV
jgi:hypothetical protein